MSVSTLNKISFSKYSVAFIVSISSSGVYVLLCMFCDDKLCAISSGVVCFVICICFKIAWGFAGELSTVFCSKLFFFSSKLRFVFFFLLF